MLPMSGNGVGASAQLRFVKSRENIRHVLKEFDLDDLNSHNKHDDCWIKINTSVFDVTPYLRFHPGGSSVILDFAGKDATAAFQEAHSWVAHEAILSSCKIGFVRSSSAVGIIDTVLSLLRGGTN